MTSTTNSVLESLPKMQYVRLGNTGMKVSRICLGCMQYGSSKWSSWVKDEKESIEDIKKAYAAGINFFDTANVYSCGESERVLGKALKEINAPRSRIVVATKVFYLANDEMQLWDDMISPEFLAKGEYVNQHGLSRKHIFDAVEGSLQRLGLDYIDLYQIHRLDRDTPMEEIMEALNDLVRSGKVRYIGASSMNAWEFQKLNSIAEKRGWAKFVSMQNLYNLVQREEEREMIPYCVDSGIAGIPWSPLAMGMLVGKNRSSKRTETAFVFKNLMSNNEGQSNDMIIDRVAELAKKYDATPAQVALAWLYTKPFITAPIVGPTKIEQLYDLIGALNVKLTEEDVKYLEEPYTPRAPFSP
ncbi:hypothetical protein G6F17_003640 [Rhizopus arrhizus]|nr:hypothetical protein G6F24_001336 [Rhizopus arrhizus]KAG0857494.1 hypothetical protein G6F17_003640 [Rhizopus arrhizus]KAG1092747.1 hypothetical protein G6F40_012776 [Rhizopus arrhizus]